MDKEIIVGGIVGLVTATSIYVWKSEIFSKIQKVILFICIILPPLQWLGIILFYIYQKKLYRNLPKRITEKKKEAILNDLLSKGTITMEEYKIKLEKIKVDEREHEARKTQEYRQLQKLYEEGILTIEEFKDKINTIEPSVDKRNSTFTIKNKGLLYGIISGALLPVIFSYLLIEANYPNQFFGLSAIKQLWTSSVYGPILRLSVLINLPLFLILLKFNKDYVARGVLFGTMIIGIYIIILHFL